jgi:benzoate membrane transport protein
MTFLATLKDHRAPILAGMVAGVTGTTASLGIAVAALSAIGASKGQTATSIVVMVALYGLLSMALAWRFKMPISIVWSTPGAAMLVAAGVLHLEFETAVGAFLVTGALLAITGMWPALGRLVSSIPKPIANAMLAGVIFNFCVAPFQASVIYPAIVLPVIAVWLLLFRFAPIWAAPAAIVLAYSLIAVFMPVDLSQVQLWPALKPVLPHFDWAAVISISIPLYLVTMASQNVPGIAIMSSFGYPIPFRAVLVSTGVTTMLGSFLGGYSLNLAAIPAAMNANEHAHPEHKKRYLASVYGGVIYLILALLVVPFIAVVLNVPHTLILAMAGIALFATITSALTTATEDVSLRLPAVITFLVGASGFSVWGIGAAFWALLAGVVVWQVLKKRS